jgi:CMP-N-acetylneuraminic acid synthetase
MEDTMKVAAFVPIKMNNERLPGKNIKSFNNGKPLLTYILNTLLKVTNVAEVYVFCSNEQICDYLPKTVKFIKRDPYLDLSTTKFNEVLVSFAKNVDADIYVLSHATAPFISVNSIEQGVEAVKKGEYDSAFTVQRLQEFLWKDNKPFNYELSNIPRTQDLDKMYMETCGLYIYTKNLILREQRRVGNNPYLIEVSKIEASDINEKEDFEIANAIYNYILREEK